MWRRGWVLAAVCLFVLEIFACATAPKPRFSRNRGGKISRVGFSKENFAGSASPREHRRGGDKRRRGLWRGKGNYRTFAGKKIVIVT